VKEGPQDPVAMKEDRWTRDPAVVQRARVVLVVSLSKRPPGELVRILMDWLDDAQLHGFCQRYLKPDELRRIEGE